ncbi:hypothetical protein HZ67_003992 [Escherichia coli]|nr:hypothetical protein [Escherichia coli]EIC6107030.1 hypothetical protein [Escherichia coli]
MTARFCALLSFEAGRKSAATNQTGEKFNEIASILTALNRILRALIFGNTILNGGYVYRVVAPIPFESDTARGVLVGRRRDKPVYEFTIAISALCLCAVGLLPYVAMLLFPVWSVYADKTHWLCSEQSLCALPSLRFAYCCCVSVR